MGELNISADLVADIKSCLEQHDASAADGVSQAQYLAALLGVVVAEITAPEDKLRRLQQQLGDFAMNVFEQQMAAKAVPSTPPAQAFGIWRPKA